MGVSHASVDVEPGDTLQFTNDSAKFPRFEVVFLGSSPDIPGLTFPGTTEIDVPVKIEGEFEYLIRHHPKSGKTVHTGVFSFGLAPAAVNKGLNRAGERFTHPLRSCKQRRRLACH
jgi:hypothetical protein